MAPRAPASSMAWFAPCAPRGSICNAIYVSTRLGDLSMDFRYETSYLSTYRMSRISNQNDFVLMPNR